MAGIAVIAHRGRGDAGAFLARLLRLDARAVVRLRPIRGEMVEIWAMLPFRVLVMRTLPGLPATSGPNPADDRTVEASALLAAIRGEAGLSDEAALPRRDERWLWSLPPSRGEVLETLPAAELARVAEAAGRALHAASTEGLAGRRVGERVLRDALLDHVPIVVTSATGERVEIPQRMVQAVVRMGFIGPPGAITPSEQKVTVRLSKGWIGLDGSYGSGWYRPNSSVRLT